MNETIRRASMLVLLVAASSSVAVLAVDGVIEINHSRALAGDVTPGDLAGFPVWITQSGSYRLTSDLIPPPGIDGISITAADVTLDLNGFGVLGSGEVGLNDGIIFHDPNVEVRNGSVRGFLRHGIFGVGVGSTHARVIDIRAYNNQIGGLWLEGEASLVDRCTTFDNGWYGIRASGNGSLVTNSVAQGNTLEGMSLGPRTGYRSCTLVDNNGGNLNAQVSSGRELGANVCGSDLVCP
jgi:hypothetical protein